MYFRFVCYSTLHRIYRFGNKTLKRMISFFEIAMCFEYFAPPRRRRAMKKSSQLRSCDGRKKCATSLSPTYCEDNNPCGPGPSPSPWMCTPLSKFTVIGCMSLAPPFPYKWRRGAYAHNRKFACLSSVILDWYLARWLSWRLWVCLQSFVPSLGHVDDAEQSHVDDGDFVLVTAALAASGGVEGVWLVLTESGISSY